MSAESTPPEPRKGPKGRPPSGVPRKEQIRRAVAARRAGFINLQLLVPPELNDALDAACKDHPTGKAAYALEVIAEHLRNLESGK